MAQAGGLGADAGKEEGQAASSCASVTHVLVGPWANSREKWHGYPTGICGQGPVPSSAASKTRLDHGSPNKHIPQEPHSLLV